MSSQLSTSIDRRIKSAVLVSDCLSGWTAHESRSGNDAQTPESHMQVVSQEAMEQLENQMGLFVRANETLNALVAHLKGYLSELLAKHKEEIPHGTNCIKKYWQPENLLCPVGSN